MLVGSQRWSHTSFIVSPIPSTSTLVLQRQNKRRLLIFTSLVDVESQVLTVFGSLGLKEDGTVWAEAWMCWIITAKSFKRHDEKSAKLLAGPTTKMN